MERRGAVTPAPPSYNSTESTIICLYLFMGYTISYSFAKQDSIILGPYIRGYPGVLHVVRWVRKECTERRCQRTDFVVDEHHMNRRKHCKVAAHLHMQILQKSHLKNQGNPATLYRHLLEQYHGKYAGSTLLFGHFPLETRTQSLLFDSISLTDASEYQALQSGKTSATRSDRIFSVAVPQCKDKTIPDGLAHGTS
jgi:hypothetical protein